MYNKQFTQVKEWSELFNMYVSNTFEVPNLKEKSLAFNLIKEELAETEKAAEEGNLVEVADGFVDLLWVLYRAMQQFGLSEETLERAFDEVNRSNSSKACSTIEEAEATKAHFLAQGVESVIIPKGDKFLISRKIDGKLLKSINYSPADIKSVLKIK